MYENLNQILFSVVFTSVFVNSTIYIVKKRQISSKTFKAELEKVDEDFYKLDFTKIKKEIKFKKEKDAVHQDWFMAWKRENWVSSEEFVISPLESFNVIVENNIKIFSNISINIFFIFFFIVLFFSYFNNKSIKKNIILINILTFFFDFFFKNFKNLVSNVRYERYFFLMLTIFVFIVFENLGSFYLLELPFNSHAVITLFLSFILFFNYVINFLINFNETSYKKFIQKDINIFIIIFLFFIELISFFIRPLSLGVRLFANILSGHISVHIFFTAFIFAFKFMFWFSLLILIFCLFILAMEIFVALVQAYIFFVLNLIYLNEISKLHI